MKKRTVIRMREGYGESGMMHQEKKLMKIVEELTTYFFSIGASDIQSGIKKEEKQAIITFQANYEKKNVENIGHLDEYLNCPKNDGMERRILECRNQSRGKSPAFVVEICWIGRIKIEEEYIYLKLYRNYNSYKNSLFLIFARESMPYFSNLLHIYK